MRVAAACAAMAIGTLLIAGCGDDGSEETAVESSPFPSVPADAVYVDGTAVCELSDDGVDLDDPEEGPGGFLAVCEFDMSDPRVNGTERHDRFRFLAQSSGGAVWLVEDATIVNDQGTWRGTAQAADDGLPTGEAHYVGEGAYEGLEFHYYFHHGDDDVVALRGWIGSSAGG